MSLTLQLSNLTTRIGTEFKSIRGVLGSLPSLATGEKGTLVGAINELYAGLEAGGTITADAITDATTTGKAVLRASNAAAARDAIGAGTSNLDLGTTSTTAKAGDYTPEWDEVASKPVVIASGDTKADARAAIDAGTSDLVIGTTSSTAKAGDYVPAWGEVTNKPLVLASGNTAEAARDEISVLSTAEVQAAISTAIENLIDGAPAAYDTLKEIADYIAANQDVLGSITTGLSNRVRVDSPQGFTGPEQEQGRLNLDVYGRTEIGDPGTNFVTVFEAALV